MKKIISCKEAKAKGLKVYFTGKACIRGHVAERRTSSRECVACESLRKKKQTPLVAKKPEIKKVILKTVKAEEIRYVRVVRFAPVQKRVVNNIIMPVSKRHTPVIISDYMIAGHC